MTASTEFTEFVLEFLEPLFPVRIARFFGGAGVYFDSVQFAMIMHNTLYFAVDEYTRKKYEKAGMQPFSYVTKKGQVQVRKYFELPEEVLNDPEQLQLWTNESIQVAYNTKKPKKVPKRSI
ncbi:TfoX/Sxy family protein [Methyloglobulus sp.]|uniref:TfoX/Sxy family protein n=1 Tax=Methyloglobulus sp. TaxID=2518622 RepID=UPI0032B7D780